MKKITELKNAESLNIEELMLIKGAVITLDEGCSGSNACTMGACSVIACRSLACNSRACDAASCGGPTCASNGCTNAMDANNVIIYMD